MISKNLKYFFILLAGQASIIFPVNFPANYPILTNQGTRKSWFGECPYQSTEQAGPSCFTRYGSPGSLANHMRDCHEGDCPFNGCKKRFPYTTGQISTVLVRHYREHIERSLKNNDGQVSMDNTRLKEKEAITFLAGLRGLKKSLTPSIKPPINKTNKRQK